MKGAKYQNFLNDIWQFVREFQVVGFPVVAAGSSSQQDI